MRWFIFCNDDLLLRVLPNGHFEIPTGETAPVGLKSRSHELTLAAHPNARSFAIDAPCAADGFQMVPLRSSFYQLPPEDYALAGKFRELLHWHQATQFCGTCGSPMQFHTEISKRCTACGREIWPQVSTAVIVRITRGDEVLLVKGRHFKRDFYGLVAGFVETGESLEEAVRREVKEETGLTIQNLRYFSSQPWPYPCGLMVGFAAEYDGGDLRLQEEELSDGGWFHRDHLPPLPDQMSIARRLIDDWIEI